ncbi:MAG: hypothetical protein JNM03_15700 [Sphingopyxis sp.]|uniref:hypothetical protein n=1 Tax=Sphingopyxis sp. TaxID=1908224 RepID=UPI001A54AA57|nr:hypothetical protein [Sphingopyxis sp.]MBL9071427.1 hypothetical protein [Sphingopyxis sp.]
MVAGKGENAMIEIAILIGLFSWGTASERLGLKHLGAVLGLSCLMGGLGGLIVGGVAAEPLTYVFSIGLELILQSATLLIGFAIGYFRHRRGAVRNADDIFG